MKYEIEVYKGQTIEYDDFYDKFVCDISVEDVWKKAKRGSLKDIKKEIDNFIKINLDFKPTKIISLDYSNDLSFNEITAIRTDGSLNIQNEFEPNTYKNFLKIVNSSDRYFEYDNEIHEEYKKLREEEKVLRNEITKKVKLLTTKLKPLDLEELGKKVALMIGKEE